MKHDVFSAGIEEVLGGLWVANDMRVALMKPTFVPNRDTQKQWASISSEEITGTGYTAGGLALTGKSAVYDAAQDRMDHRAADSTWGPGATFAAAFAVIYDNTMSGKPLWSLVDFEETKTVDNGVFTIDWAAIALVYQVPVLV